MTVQLISFSYAYVHFSQGLFHYENKPIQIYGKFYHQKKKKNENFSDENLNIFQISVQNIDCGHSLEPPQRGGSNEYPQSTFLSRNKNNNVYPCKPQFCYIHVLLYINFGSSAIIIFVCVVFAVNGHCF